MDGSFNIDGIHITPSVVEFRDIVQGCIYQTHVNIQNVGGTSKRIRFHAPSSQKFQLHCKSADKVIAPGLEVSALIEFRCDKEEDCHSKFLLLIDDDPIEMPVTAIASKPGMEITSDVDFGTVIADGKVLRQEIAILNRGSRNGAFKLNYEGKQPISFVPRQGVVKAGYSQPIRFEFNSKQPGTMDEIVKVSMEGQPDTQIRVLAQMALRSLQLLSLEDEKPVNYINFGPTFYGTDVLQSYLLFNKSPDKVSFVVILEEEGEGQEVGVDLSLIKSVALLDIGSSNLDSEEDDLTSLVTAFPSQGTLGPFEKRLLHFKFSPRYSRSNQGWSSSENPVPRKDYALFLHIDIVGNMSSNARNLSSNDSRVEVALTGTALPVLLSVLPSPIINFENCPVGSNLDCKVTVRNDSPDLPVEFIISKCAHFVSFPQSGRLEANGFIELLVSFRPNQIGHFWPTMDILVQGFIMESCDDFCSLPKFKQISLCKYPLQVDGKSLPVLGKKTSKSLSAQGRLFPQETNDKCIELVQSDVGTSLKVFKSSNDGIVGSKSLEATSTRDCKIAKEAITKIAEPDDMAMSIRPSNKKENVLTHFTKTKRYTYVDPDYEYSAEEDVARRKHKQKYVDYIHRVKNKNVKKGIEGKSRKYDRSVNAGLPSNKDLQPMTPSSKETPNKSKKGTTSGTRLLTSKNLDDIRLAASNEKVVEGLKALPTTEEERSHCSRKLSPVELYQVVLEPDNINFGDVCLKSLASKKMKIVNSLQKHIHVKVEIDCRELRQTSPLSQVIPPGRVAALEFVFESSVIGHFERSVSYTINGHHHGHLVVLADVVNVSLTLSSNRLLLSLSPGLPPEAGMRETVTLYNKHNVPAQFFWTPVVGKDGTAFSVRPARGTLDSYSNLVCEVVFYPSFYAPLSGMFQLNVENGNQLDLHTEAEIASTSCTFIEHRVMFGAVPLNLVTTRSAFLKNTSQNHAYFKVNDVSPIHGMTISPATGIVPVGGSTELRIEYKPISVQKFDTQIEVAIRGWKPVYLRMGGHVEAPCVDIDIESFQFGGVYCGARSILPFKLKNVARSRAKVTFDLTERKDFSLVFGAHAEEASEVSESDGIFETVLFGQQDLQCYLEFRPKEIASYDFIVSAVINETTAPSPPPSPYPASVTLSKPSQGSEDPKRCSKYPTPSRRIQATALRAPLQVSNTDISFSLPPGYYDMGIENAAGRTAGVMFVNNSNAPISWYINLDDASQFIEDGTFQLLHRSGSPYKFAYNGDHIDFPTKMLGSGEMSSLGILFSPAEPGLYETVIPVILDDNARHPYRLIHLRGELAAPVIQFEPKAIQFLPAPLRTKTTVELSIIAQGFRKATSIKAIVHDVELEDGSQFKVFDVDFPNGNTIEACCQDVGKNEQSVVQCRITFQSPKPASVNTCIKFVTDQVSYQLPVIATADNCLMTSYKFLAFHQADFHIVCDGLASKDAGINGNRTEYKGSSLIPCLSAIKSPTEKSNATTSTSFGLLSSTYQESSFSSSTAKSPESENKDGEDHEETTIPYEFDGTEDTADTDEERYIKDVGKSVQRWFSSQAWANGPSPIVLPFSLRSCFSTGIDANDTTRAGIWSREKKKESKTIFDMVTHLCGKAIPGIPINGSVPTEPFDRTRYIHWMYTVLISFLRCQGAIVAAIRPEFLLDKDDFKRFIVIRGEDMAKAGLSLAHDSLDKDIEKYETLSKYAWTDLLLQIIKVLVLNRVTPQQYRKVNLPINYAPLPPLNVDPFSSNVYSIGEKIILAWANHHFQQQRDSWLWKASVTGDAPSSRWIVNFDNDFLDGLVLASILAAYAPFIVSRFLYSMYTHPTTAEQCLHNALKVVSSLRYLGMDYDVVATDITEPNPISVLLLCTFLYHRLPHYLPRSSIEFNASLHSSVTKKIKLQNPSSKPIVYQIIITGDDASDFYVPSGKMIKVASKTHINLEVQYKARFLRSCSAVLILVGKRAGFQVGSTLVFKLTASIETIIPMAVYRTESPCYELKKVAIDIKNPFGKTAAFKVILVEVEQPKQGASNPSKEKIKKKSLKSVESKTDHGNQPKAQSKHNEMVMESENMTSTADKADSTGSNVSVFWCSTREISVNSDKKEVLEVQFLPFSTGHFQCSVLLISEEVGDIVYSIEAESCLPLPAALPFQPSSHIVRLSSAEDAEKRHSFVGDNARTVYWRCNINEQITEDIVIPLVNEARENALVLATQQRMSEKERWRREITGSLSAAAVSNALQSMGLQERISSSPKSSHAKSGILTFEVEGSSKYFKVPSLYDLNMVKDRRSALCTAKMPVKFNPDGPGHYQCRIVLRASTDIRVFQVEATVNPEGSDIELEFTSPTHEYVTQNIPVVNNSEQDWALFAKINGTGFYGPDKLYCQKFTTAAYELKFQPVFEGIVKGSLKLTNTVSGTETVFLLRGEGRKPSPSDHVELACQVNDITFYEFQIPNMSNKKMIFQAFCNLGFVSGPEYLMVLPRQTGAYKMAVKPWKRGIHDGIVSFVSDVADSGVEEKMMDSDSDDDDVVLPQSNIDIANPKRCVLPDFNAHKFNFEKPFRIWYSLKITAQPSPPINILEVESACHSRATIELLMENPTDTKIEYDVIVEGRDLIAGEETLSVQPKAAGIYHLDYVPTVIGNNRGSVIFQNDLVGEVWYDIILVSVPPMPKDLKMMQCPLGSKCLQMIRVDNPSDDEITYDVTCSNTRNFWLELKNNKVDVLPHSGIEVPLTFSPSTLGIGLHQAQITFRSKKLGDFVFNVKGNGLLPARSEDYVIRTSISSSSSTIISFENPFEEDIVINVELAERTMARLETYLVKSGDHYDNAFSLLLRKTKDILLPPKAKLAIPICFSPESMIRYETVCNVVATKKDGSLFPHGREMKWVFPVIGIPEFSPLEGKKVPCIECKTRNRVEEMLHLSFTGHQANVSGFSNFAHSKIVSSNAPPQSSSLTDFGSDYLFVPDDFDYKFEYADAESHSAVDRSVGINLAHKMVQKVSGVISLVFNVVFSPYKTFSHVVQLIITSSKGGIWRYPIRFVATEPDPDDVIELEAAGLNKDVSVGFRLTSQTDSYVPFWVTLDSGINQMFSVTPLSGELPPVSTTGQLFKVTYRPKCYGKVHTSKLTIQTPDIQWTYELKGRIPKYFPPVVSSTQDRTMKRF